MNPSTKRKRNVPGGAGIAAKGAQRSRRTERNFDCRIDQEQEVERLRQAMMRLRAPQRLALALHYVDELQQQRIVSVVDVTEFRVSQIRTNAIARLQAGGRSARRKEPV